MSITAKDFASKYAVKEETVVKAMENLARGKSFLLGVSGRLGSGKDTIAPLVLEKTGYIKDSLHVYFAQPLREEMNRVIEFIKASAEQDEASETIASEMKLPKDQASKIVEALWSEVKSRIVLNSQNRTDAMRFALQFWGTEIRRNQDTNYWVKRAIVPAVEALASGKSSFFTDARFPNEVDALSDLGAKVLRLLVSPEEQRARIIARDGQPPTAASIEHISENALDEYEALNKFDIIVDTSDKDADEVTQVVLDSLREENAHA